ncbi:hypothetical protein BOTBODRAFT_29646 [Botryobasidium botryosum FD-172 SS1]|uniref:BAH domain-containing protein n=1 Tax=Botryobasidium botryosum (strain FD-172 SS1) TaxID=930990 RepID=A0A067MNY6_BOTB1|nr:hypothetical protein BOTBODRAFT_29646 [Botryobasidium botryosum FD-172 SS1]
MAITEVQKTAIKSVLHDIYSYTSSPGGRGRELHKMFDELPDRTTWKEYYAVIPEPRCLDGVKATFEKGAFNDPLELFSDISLVFSNALHFNEEGSVIYKDANILKALLARSWAAQPSLPQPPATPPPQNKSTEDDTKIEPDIDMASPNHPTMDDGERDPQGDDIIRRLEATLPKWSGPGDAGWMTSVSGDPHARYSEIVNAIKTYRVQSTGDRPAEALEQLREQTDIQDLYHKDPISLSIIESRSQTRFYQHPKDFDVDMFRLFEKGRRWYEAGSTAYGRIILLQRLYHHLTTTSSTTSTATTNFASISAGPGNAKPLRSVESTSEAGVTTFRIPSKDRDFQEEAHFKGTAYKTGDYVHLMNPDDPAQPIIGQIFRIWKPTGAPLGQVSLTACWYFRPEQTVHPANRQFWENEVFKTGHFADHAIEDVMEKIACQFTTKHIRGRPRPPNWYPGWPLYVCDSRYNDREKVFVKIKNWASCIPEDLRKADFMAIHPFEAIVWPRKLGSPFLKGVKGPGGIGDSTEKAEGEKILGGGTGRKRPRRAAAASTPAAPAANPSANIATEPILQSQPLPPQAMPQRRTDERTIVTAAGGLPALGPNPLMETLPHETVRHFDRDPVSGQLFWFPGPPLDKSPLPNIHTPRHSLKYLAFLAEKERGSKSNVAGQADRVGKRGHPED